MGVKEQKVASVQSEIARERADALARGTQRLRATLDKLREPDAGASAGGNGRSQLVAAASEACLAYLIQREIMGFGAQDAESIRREFEVPQEVWSGMGAMRPLFTK